MTRIPDAMGPEQIGPYFKLLREQFKLSTQDVSERLHIRQRYITAMEEANYEALPGKVYARGYVHTYAEFLGLDADQVVLQAFPELEATEAKKENYEPKMLQSPPVSYGPNWKLLGGVAVILALLVYGYVAGGDTADAPAVQDTPQDQQVGYVVMPMPRHYDCLTKPHAPLACFYAQHMLQELQQIERVRAAQYAEEIAWGIAHAPLAAEIPVVEEEAVPEKEEEKPAGKEKPALSDAAKEDNAVEKAKESAPEKKTEGPSTDKPAEAVVEKPKEKPAEAPTEGAAND